VLVPTPKSHVFRVCIACAATHTSQLRKRTHTHTHTTAVPPQAYNIAVAKSCYAPNIHIMGDSTVEHLRFPLQTTKLWSAPIPYPVRQGTEYETRMGKSTSGVRASRHQLLLNSVELNLQHCKVTENVRKRARPRECIWHQATVLRAGLPERRGICQPPLRAGTLPYRLPKP